MSEKFSSVINKFQICRSSILMSEKHVSTQTHKGINLKVSSQRHSLHPYERTYVLFLTSERVKVLYIYALSITLIIFENGFGYLSSNPNRDCSHFP